MAQLNQRIGGRAPNLREMLLKAGIGEFNATLSIPYMYFMPRTCDPYAAGIVQLIEGLQNLLNARGEHLEIDGWLGRDTAAALAKYAGNAWPDKSWMQLYGDVLRGRRAPGFERDHTASTPDVAQQIDQAAVGGVTDLATSILTSPVAWIAAGGALYYFFGVKRHA